MARVSLRVKGSNAETAYLIVDYATNLWICGSRYFGHTNGGNLSWFEVFADHYGYFWEWVAEDWQLVAGFERMPLHPSDFKSQAIAAAWIYRAPALMKAPLRWEKYRYDPLWDW
jgi:hypothetical protein